MMKRRRIRNTSSSVMVKEKEAKDERKEDLIRNYHYHDDEDEDEDHDDGNEDQEGAHSSSSFSEMSTGTTPRRHPCRPIPHRSASSSRCRGRSYKRVAIFCQTVVLLSLQLLQQKFDRIIAPSSATTSAGSGSGSHRFGCGGTSSIPITIITLMVANARAVVAAAAAAADSGVDAVENHNQQNHHHHQQYPIDTTANIIHSDLDLLQQREQQQGENMYQVETFVDKRKYFSQFENDDDVDVEEGEFEKHHATNNYYDGAEKNDDESNTHYEPVIIVATVDGSLAGLSKTTGRILWKRTKKQQEDQENQQEQSSSTSSPPLSSILNPLISTTTTKTSSSLSTNDWRTSAVPSIDGYVYLTASTPSTTGSMASTTTSTTKTTATGGGGGGGNDQVTVTTSIADLVSRSPFVDARGRIYTGSRHSTVFGIHCDSGEILKVMMATSTGDTSAAADNDNNNNNDDGADDSWQKHHHHHFDSHTSNVHDHVVWMGRVDYSVSVHEARSGELDVQFSSGRIMGVSDMLLGGGERGTDRIHRADNSKQSSSAASSSSSTSPTTAASARNSGYFAATASSLLSSPSTLVTTPNGNVAFRNVHTGQVEWVANAAFDTPVIFAVDATSGASLTVDLVPDAVLPNGSTEYVSKEMERQMDLVYQREQQQQHENRDYYKGHQEQHDHEEHDSDYDHDNSDSDEQTIVGFLPSTGDLFAMPLGRPHGTRPSSMLYRRHSQHTTASSSSANSVAAPTASLSSPSKSSSAVALHASRFVGRYRRSAQQNQQQDYPTDSHHNKQQNRETFLCHPRSPYFPSCLDVDQHHQSASTTVAKYHHHHHHYHPNFDYDYEQHRQGGHGAGGFHIPSPRHSTEYHNYHHQHHQQQHPNILLVKPDKTPRTNYQKMLRILGSWLPPTIALLFVVSFELGRRKRGQQLQQNQFEQKQLESNALLSTSTTEDGTQGSMQTSTVVTAITTTETTLVTGSITPSSTTSAVGGVIQVFDDVILGYGGHGTVVYKGMLEGRQVAVKRMLRAYHASADREISLLIESDGHPNVVRYFLKEVRGDFVYLALELCDLSLHDLILKLKSCRSSEHHNHHSSVVGGDGGGGDGSGEKENMAPLARSPMVSSATRDILFQISSGVKHIHSLRIVHRDLKPMNILLADSRKNSKLVDDESVLVTFESGNYIAKISDMGLGKQLVGQSSYGASIMGDASLRGSASNGAHSSIVGTGPGSVGWQAPEVMALRATSDECMRSDEPLNDSCPDASPVDAAINARSSRSVDIFSLGCIFYSTLIPGCHPFGEWYEREANIMHNRPNIDALEDVSLDALDLVSSMIQRSQLLRPTAAQICNHPFFWAPDRRLSFLCDFSDRIEIEGVNTEGNSPSNFAVLSLAVERNAALVVGLAWDSLLDVDLISNVHRFRTYDPSSVRDLLRLIRNKNHHFDELPKDLKCSMGSNTDGLVRYFEARFPRLLIHCFNICRELLPCDDPLSQKYAITPLGRSNVGKRMDVQISRITEASAEESEEAHLQPQPDNPPSTPILLDDEAASGSGAYQSQLETSQDKSQQEEGSETPEMPENVPIEQEKAESEATVATDDLVKEEEGHQEEQPLAPPIAADDLVIWEGSTAARMFNCRGWSRSDEEWERRMDAKLRKRDTNLMRCAEDPKFRTRLCNYWDASLGTSCPMKKKSKCIFAHGPVELRVKEGKRHRWGKLVDKNGDNNNPNHSGGEDTYGAARTIEQERKQEGKWSTDKNAQQQPKGKKSNNSNPAKKKKAPTNR